MKATFVLSKPFFFLSKRCRYRQNPIVCNKKCTCNSDECKNRGYAMVHAEADAEADAESDTESDAESGRFVGE